MSPTDDFKKLLGIPTIEPTGFDWNEFLIGGSFTESVTLVGNSKIWESDKNDNKDNLQTNS